jgi:hypothetical protein
VLLALVTVAENVRPIRCVLEGTVYGLVLATGLRQRHLGQCCRARHLPWDAV